MLVIAVVAFHFDWSSVGVRIPLISIVLTAIVLVSEIRAVMDLSYVFCLLSLLQFTSFTFLVASSEIVSYLGS